MSFSSLVRHGHNDRWNSSSLQAWPGRLFENRIIGKLKSTRLTACQNMWNIVIAFYVQSSEIGNFWAAEDLIKHDLHDCSNDYHVTDWHAIWMLNVQPCGVLHHFAQAIQYLFVTCLSWSLCFTGRTMDIAAKQGAGSRALWDFSSVRLQVDNATIRV